MNGLLFTDTDRAVLNAVMLRLVKWDANHLPNGWFIGEMPVSSHIRTLAALEYVEWDSMALDQDFVHLVVTQKGLDAL